MGVHVGFDRGDKDVREAEHWFAELLGDRRDRVVACTHLLRVPSPHVAFSIALPRGSRWSCHRSPTAAGRGGPGPGGAPLGPGRPGVRLSRARRPHRRADRRGTTVPQRDRARTVMGGAPATPDTLVETRDYVRPLWMAGRLTLVTLPHGPAGSPRSRCPKRSPAAPCTRSIHRSVDRRNPPRPPVAAPAGRCRSGAPAPRLDGMTAVIEVRELHKRYGARSPSTTSPSRSTRARSSASSGRTAPARPRRSNASRGCAAPTGARSGCWGSTRCASTPS